MRGMLQFPARAMAFLRPNTLKLYRSSDTALDKNHNQQTGNVDVRDHESRCEPRFSEGLHLESRRAQPHGKIDEEVQRAEYFAEYRSAIGSLQQQNDRYSDRELKQRKIHHASYRSDQQ